MNNYQENDVAIERELLRLLEEALYQNMPSTQNTRSTARTTQTRQSRPSRTNNIHIPMFSRENQITYLDILQYLREVMYIYNTNIQEYQRNFQMSLQIINNITQALIDENNTTNDYYYTVRQPETVYTRHTRPSTYQTTNNPSLTSNSIPLLRTLFNVDLSLNYIPENNTTEGTRYQTQTATPSNRNHLFSYILYRPTIRHQDATALRNFFQNIIIRPSQQQIDNATQMVQYNTQINNINTSCPITLEDFQDGEFVRQIKHCGHMFQEQAIQNWFQSNVRCPVCRYDIREYVSSSTNTSNQETTEPSNEETNEDLDHPPTPTSVSNIEEIENSEGFEELIQELSENFAMDIHSIINDNLTDRIMDSSQNFVFEFSMESNV